ncbi:MAG: hypothetical protein H0U79_00940 [Solirubrobacterales bacterium]|nr:hypothetical protein [Solirubrobacterales bacterium]
MEQARNVAIIVGLAVVVAFVPGGGDGADLLGQIVGAVFLAAIVVMLVRLYRRFRSDIFGLGDRWRAILYVSLATIALTLAGARELAAGGGGLGILACFVLLGGAAYGLYATWKQYRSYA